MSYRIKLRREQIFSADIDAVERLCKWLGIPEGYTKEHKSLYNWLVFQDIAAPSYRERFGMYG